MRLAVRVGTISSLQIMRHSKLAQISQSWEGQQTLQCIEIWISIIDRPSADALSVSSIYMQNAKPHGISALPLFFTPALCQKQMYKEREWVDYSDSRRGELESFYV